MNRSIRRTGREIAPYFSGFSLTSAWEIVERFTRRAAAFAGCIVVLCVIVAPFQPVPAQNGDTAFRLNSAESRLNKLDEVPAQIARILEHQIAQDQRSREISDQILWIQRETLVGAAGLIMWGASMMINSMKEKKR